MAFSIYNDNNLYIYTRHCQFKLFHTYENKQKQNWYVGAN